MRAVVSVPGDYVSYVGGVEVVEVVGRKCS